MPDSFVCVQAVDVEKIDLAICEERAGFVEGHPKQLCKSGVVVPGVRLYFLEHAVVISARVGIASPRIYSHSPALDSGLLDRLAEGKERFTRVGAQFNEEQRAQR